MLDVHFAHPIPFDIPDSVWLAAGAQGWRPAAQSYVACAYRSPRSEIPQLDLAIEWLSLDQVVPPVRNGGAPGFVDWRMLRALRGMKAGDPVPAVLGQRRDDYSAALVPILDGMHRFYASAALGFTHLPVAIQPY